MRKDIVLASADKCTGCGVCAAICPKGCISMSASGRIHNYPVRESDDCIECEKCMTVCPVLQFETRQQKTIPDACEQIFYAAWHNDTEIKKTATSGAVASALYQTALSHGYYICGADFDENWHLAHRVSHSESDIEKFKGSKYLQSDTSKVYKIICDLLKDDKKVLFVGTPCQVDALCRFIPARNRSQLVACAIICHGVNSPVVWEVYIKYLQEKERNTIVRYNFRSKAFGWGKLCVDYTFADGRCKVIPANKNLFHYWFGKHYQLRPSCIKCSYRGVQRYADITIGDFWGIEKIFPTLNTTNGVSVLITSSRMGRDFVMKCKNITLLETDASKTPSVLKGLLQKKGEDILNAELDTMYAFERDYVSGGFTYAQRKYKMPSAIDRILKIILGK